MYRLHSLAIIESACPSCVWDFQSPCIVYSKLKTHLFSLLVNYSINSLDITLLLVNYVLHYRTNINNGGVLVIPRLSRLIYPLFEESICALASHDI